MLLVVQGDEQRYSFRAENCCTYSQCYQKCTSHHSVTLCCTHMYVTTSFANWVSTSKKSTISSRHRIKMPCSVHALYFLNGIMSERPHDSLTDLTPLMASELLFFLSMWLILTKNLGQRQKHCSHDWHDAQRSLQWLSDSDSEAVGQFVTPLLVVSVNTVVLVLTRANCSKL